MNAPAPATNEVLKRPRDPISYWWGDIGTKSAQPIVLKLRTGRELLFSSTINSGIRSLPVRRCAIGCRGSPRSPWTRNDKIQSSISWDTDRFDMVPTEPTREWQPGASIHNTPRSGYGLSYYCIFAYVQNDRAVALRILIQPFHVC